MADPNTCKAQRLVFTHEMNPVNAQHEKMALFVVNGRSYFRPDGLWLKAAKDPRHETPMF